MLTQQQNIKSAAGLGMAVTETCPDTFGLQEFYVTDIATEVMGGNVRVVCGVRRGGSVHWLYSAVMPADLLLMASRQCADAACEAFNRAQMEERRVAH
jgi:hypothetical protein